MADGVPAVVDEGDRWQDPPRHWPAHPPAGATPACSAAVPLTIANRGDRLPPWPRRPSLRTGLHIFSRRTKTQLVSMQSRNQFALTRAQSRFMQRHRTGRGEEEPYRPLRARHSHRALQGGWPWRKESCSSGSQIVGVGAIARKILIPGESRRSSVQAPCAAPRHHRS